MANLKERFQEWKQRKWHQKLSDILFILLIVALVIPGPRKFVATAVNKAALNFKRPSMAAEENAYQLSAEEMNWDIYTAEGVKLTEADLKGEVIFLNYWGTFCPPCIAEMPEIQGIYDDYKDKVKFILVSGESPEKVNGFLKDKGYELPSYHGGRSMPQVLSARSIPTTYIISKEGKIVTKKVGAADWNSKATRKVFDELLAR